jgi:hypothetical protein
MRSPTKTRSTFSGAYRRPQKSNVSPSTNQHRTSVTHSAKHRRATQPSAGSRPPRRPTVNRPRRPLRTSGAGPTHLCRHRITGREFGREIDPGTEKDRKNRLFFVPNQAKRHFPGAEPIFLGCIFNPRVSNRPRFRHSLPGSGSRWGTTAHNFS